MKATRSIFQVKGILAAILIAGAPFVIAQTVDLSTGTVLDSATSPTVLPVPNPAPTQLTATILPIGESTKTSGEMIFTVVGDAVSVLGRIIGLDPNKRYQAVLQTPLKPLVSPTTIPGAATDTANPASTSLQAGASPPAAPAAGSEETKKVVVPVTAPALEFSETDLVMIISDARGTANLNATIQKKDLTPPPAGVLGCTIVIKRAPPLDTREERTPVASGVIVAPVLVIQPPPGPR